MTGNFSTDPIMGDPGFDTTNWQLMAPGPLQFTAAQMPGAPVVGFQYVFQIGLNPLTPTLYLSIGLDNFACYPIPHSDPGGGVFFLAGSGGCIAGQPGIGTYTNAAGGIYNTFTITLDSPFAAANGGNCPINGCELTIDLVGGPSNTDLGFCSIPNGGTTCTASGLNVTLKAGDPLGVTLRTWSPSITSPASENFGKFVTISLTP